jgi:hypothetical protein
MRAVPHRVAIRRPCVPFPAPGAPSSTTFSADTRRRSALRALSSHIGPGLEGRCVVAVVLPLAAGPLDDRHVDDRTWTFDRDLAGCFGFLEFLG